MFTLLLVLSGVAEAAPSVPPAAVLALSDAEAIRALIADQIAAFRRDDAEGAWRHVSPGLQAKFGTADTFLFMVRSAYRPVHSPQSYTFGPLEETPEGFRQWLELVGPDGERVGAQYLLERQADGTWRTDGCLITERIVRPAV